MNSTTILRDIPFATDRHPRLSGDLYLPAQLEKAPVALVIHGGGWMNSDKSSLAPVCHLLAQHGIAAFTVNYRRIVEAPWPACMEDCVSAFDFLRDPTFLAAHGLQSDSLLVVGASAGGHLALMTALSRPAGQVSAILAIAPPTTLEVNAACCDSYLFTPAFFATFFGNTALPTADQLWSASPLSLVNHDSPPLWIVQSRNDLLVPPQHAEDLMRAYEHHHRPVSCHYFDGPDTVHGLWIDNTATDRTLTSQAHAALTSALTELKGAPPPYPRSRE